MISQFGSPRLIAAAAGAALLATALPAWAQDAQTAAPPAETTYSIEDAFIVEIPEIVVENGTMSADAIRAVLLGAVMDHAEDLAALSADRISIPEVRVRLNEPGGGPDATSSFVYRDIALVSVRDGVAAEATIGETLLEMPEGVTGQFGVSSVTDVDIGAVLAFYGMVAGDGTDTGFRTAYRDFNFVGGSFGGPDFTCAVGGVSVEEFRVRPLRTSFGEFMELAVRIEAAEEEPAPEDLARFAAIYADLLTAFESSPAYFEGMNCAIDPQDGEDFVFAMGPAEMEGFTAGIYPAVTLSEMSFVRNEGPNAGSVTFETVTVKGFDYTTQAELLSDPALLDADWFEENWRSLIPAFEGFALSGLAIDIPDPSGEGRIDASLGAFDLTLANYFNAVPTAISTSAESIVLVVPPEGGDEHYDTLRGLGIERLDLGFDVALAWDAETETIEIGTVALRGADLGSIAIAGLLVNATTDLFANDPEVATFAGLMLAVSRLNIDIVDRGIVDLVMTLAGAEDNASPQQMRPMFAGVAEGMTIGLLGGSEMGVRVGAALNAFLRGTSDTLSIDIESLDPDGVALSAFIAAGEDPTALIERVTIDAEAR